MAARLLSHRGEEELRTLGRTWETLLNHPEGDLEVLLSGCRLRPNVVAPWALSVWEERICRAIICGRLERVRVGPSLGYARLPAIPGVRMLVVPEGWLGTLDLEAAEPVTARLEGLLREWGADLCTLPTLREESPLWPVLRRRVRRTRGVRRPWWTRHWVLRLEGNPQGLLRQMRAKHRGWYHRKAWGLARAFPGQVRWYWLPALEQVDEVCQQMEEVACRTYQRGLGAGFVDNPETRECLNWLARRGRLRVMVLEVAARPVGFWLGAVLRDTFHARATAYRPDMRPYEVGTAMLVRLTGELVREGIAQVDWGQGDVEYKQRFGTHAWREAHVELFANSARGRCLRLYKGVGEWINRSLRKGVERLGVLNRVKQAWRRRLARS